ncbi:unnamed protein product [Ranitomeya imitator]|uniref:Uncharacterized protein n=1 Tax=Ranitomeya imitator TaxID=111125 RepID=A0ABN9M842_9NEOB|nr:unnamed protein product [Ranitomeya imitator]
MVELPDWGVRRSDASVTDEEDVADVCEWRIGSQQNCSEDSYLPSSHHTPSIQLPVYSACYIVVGQFEDAEQ